VLRSRAFVPLLAFAFALRVWWVHVTPHYRPRHDDHSYLVHALALVDTGEYPLFMRHGIEQPTAYRAPGFPFALAAARSVLGPELTGPRIAQAAVGAIVVALVGIVAGEIWGRRTALVAMAIAAVSPLLVVYGGSLISEPLFTALLLGAMACALHAHGRVPWAVAAGVLGGAAALTRPAGLLALVALALCAGSRRAGVALLAAGVLAVVPWTIRNAEVMHAFIPVSTEAGNTLAGTYNPKSAKDGRWRDPRLSHLWIPERRRARTEVATDATLTRAVISYVAHHPFQPVRTAAYNAGRIAGVAPTSFAAFSLHTVSLTTRPALLVRIGLFVVAALALAGLLTRAARRAPPGWWLAAGLVLASTLLVNAEQRFAIPVTAVLAPLAALPLTRGT
jgi:4-amino-4-deoxy-L-arabinose transferase-like glycosyltransferase